MKTTSVEYSKTFNLGNYSNEKIGVVIELQHGIGETVADAMAHAKREVEKAHHFFKQLPHYEKSLEIEKNPADYTGRQVTEAKELIEVFNSNYKDYMTNMGPIVRTLTQGREDELDF